MKRDKSTESGNRRPVRGAVFSLLGPLLSALGSLLFPTEAQADEPFGLRRVMIDPDRISAEVRQQQELLAVPRKEFEDTVRRAAQTLAALANPPRVSETRYSASWHEGHLTGTAEWKIYQPNDVPGWLTLEPWNLALRSRPQLDGRPAIVVNRGRKEEGGRRKEEKTNVRASSDSSQRPAAGLADAAILLHPSSVMVPGGPGVHTLAMSWSLGSERRPEGDWFHLLLPTAAIALLELDLPADRILELPAARQFVTSVSIPGDLSPRKFRRWRIAFGGEDRAAVDLELLVRPAEDLGKSTLAIARPTAEYRVGVAGVEARFDVELEVYHGKLKQLNLDLDSNWEPVEVQVRQASSQPAAWRISGENGNASPGEGGNSRLQLCVTPAEPIEKRATLTVHARSRNPGAERPNLQRTFAIPRLRVSGIVLGQMSLRIGLSPEVALTDWRFGDFRPVRREQLQPETQTGAAWEFVYLIQARFSGLDGPVFPTARVQSPALDAAVQQDSWWHISREQSRLTVNLTWQLRTGRLSTLALQLPKGWEVDNLDVKNEAAPVGVLSQTTAQQIDWYLDNNVPRRLTVSLRYPVRPGAPLHMTLRLRPTVRILNLNEKMELPVPRVTPLGVQWQDASLRVTLERGQGGKGQPLFKATASGMMPPNITIGTGGLALIPFLPSPSADHYYTYHGPSPLSRPSSLIIEPLAPSVRVQSLTDIVHTPQQRTVSYTLYVQPLVGSPSELRVGFATSVPVSRWEVVAGTNAIDSQQKSRTQDSGLGSQELWALHFHEPIADRITVRATASLPPNEELTIPMPSLEGTANLHITSDADVTVETAGLQPTEPGPQLAAQSAAPIWRAYRHGPQPATLTLHKSSRPAELATDSATVVESAELISQVDTTGVVLSHYRVRVRNARRQPLSLNLPMGARLVNLVADNASVAEPESIGNKVALPSGGLETEYELVYSQEYPAWSLVASFAVAPPRWEPAIPVLQFRRTLQLPSSYALVSNGAYRDTIGGEGQVQVGAVSCRTYELSGAEAAFFGLRNDLVHYAGLLAAVALFGIGQLARRWGIERRWYLGLSLWIGILALAWLPDGLRPIAFWLLAATVLRAWTWQAPRGPVEAERQSNKEKLRQATIAILVCMSAYCLVSTSAGGSLGDADEKAALPTIVYLLPPPAGQPDQQTALVPRRLWKKLTDLGQSDHFDVPAWAFEEVNYVATLEAQEKGTAALNQGGSPLFQASPTIQVDADFHVQVLARGSVTVVVPVGNVHLRQALLDSAPVLAAPHRTRPTPEPGVQPEAPANKSDIEGIAVSVEGQGSHLIHLTWDAPVQVRGTEREAHWPTPPIAEARLALSLPATVAGVRAVGARGGQWVSYQPNSTQLQVDLGNISDVKVRWLRANAKESVANTVRDVYLIELKPQEARLMGVLHYQITEGAASTLRLKLPEGIYPKAVEVTGDPGQEPVPRLQNWSVGTDRQLTLDFSYPVSGHVRVQLDMVIYPPSLSPLSGAVQTLTIPFPAPQDAKRAIGWWAFRAEQLQVTPLPAQAKSERELQPEQRNGAAEPFHFSDFGSLISDFRFLGFRISDFPLSPMPSSGTSVALQIRRLEPKVQARQRLTLGLSFAEADLQAMLDLSVSQGSLAFAEWQIPSQLKVADVQGANLLRWSRQGRILQLWFREPVTPARNGKPGATSLTLTGWLSPHNDEARKSDIPMAKPENRDSAFESQTLGSRPLSFLLPNLGILGAQMETTMDRVCRQPMTVKEEGGVLEIAPLNKHEGGRIKDENQGKSAAGGGAREESATTSSLPNMQSLSPKPAEPLSSYSTACRVLLVEYLSRLDADLRAIHEAKYVLFHDPGADFTLAFPAGAVFLSCILDGQDISHLVNHKAEGGEVQARTTHHSPQTLRVHLPASEGWCEVTLRWSVSGPRIDGGKWQFTPPQLEGPAAVPAIWAIHLPAAIHAVEERQYSGANARAWQSLYRSEALGKLAGLLASRWKDRDNSAHELQIAKAELRFYGQMHEAERQLAAANGDADRAAAARLDILSKEHQRVLRESPWDDVRKRSEDVAKNLPAPRSELELVRNRTIHRRCLVLAFPENRSQFTVALTDAGSASRQLAILVTLAATLLIGGLLLVGGRQGTKKPLAA